MSILPDAAVDTLRIAGKDKTVNVLVFGNFDQLRAGDNRLRHTLARLLHPGGEIAFVPYQFKLPARYTRFYDWLILAGGSPFAQRRKIRRGLKRCIKQHPAKFLAVGLHVDRGFHRPLAAFALAKSRFFSVSDRHSAELLGDDPRVHVCTDLRWCWPLDATIPPDRSATADVAVNLAPSGQRPLDPDLWLNQLTSYSLAPFPLSDRESDQAPLRRCFPSMPAECTIAPLRNCRVLLASEYSAILFALQLQKPFVAIDTGEEVHRLVYDAGFEDCLLDPGDHQSVARKIAYVLQSPAIVRRLDSYAYNQSRSADDLHYRISETMGLGDFPRPSRL